MSELLKKRVRDFLESERPLNIIEEDLDTILIEVRKMLPGASYNYELSRSFDREDWCLKIWYSNIEQDYLMLVISLVKNEIYVEVIQ